MAWVAVVGRAVVTLRCRFDSAMLLPCTCAVPEVCVLGGTGGRALAHRTLQTSSARRLSVRKGCLRATSANQASGWLLVLNVALHNLQT